MITLYTNLTPLPELPDSIKYLNYSNNHLTSLPKLPDSLQKLYCSKNPLLASLPELPDSLISIDIHNTPAAKDPKVIARLEAFKETHPYAYIRY